MAKIILINAFEDHYLGTRVLASYLRKFGHKTHNILLGDGTSGYSLVQDLQEDHLGYMIFVDEQLISHAGNTHPLSQEDFLALERIIEEEHPDVIGFSARSTNNYLAPDIVAVLRQAAPDALRVAGGYGPTLEPELYLDAGFDVIIRGDGEEALLELMHCCDKKDISSATKIQNTCWNKIYGGVKNSLRNQEKSLEKYPPQLYGNESFSLVKYGMVKRHYDPMLETLNYHTYLGRGCHGKCTYCSGGQWKNLYRNEGVKAYPRRNRNMYDVLEECKSLPESIKFITFTDEFWSMSTEKTKKFFTLYKQHVHKPFFAYLQYEQMINNPELFETILDAGLQMTGIGFQHGYASFLQKYYGRKAHYDILLKYTKMLFDNFIRCNCQFIAGNCYETERDFLECLSLIRTIPSHIEFRELAILDIFRLRPHPKTPITVMAPRTVTEPMPANDYLYRAICMFLANKMDFDELKNIMSATCFKKDAMLFYDFSHSFMYRQRKQHYKALMETEAGKDWVFVGAGDTYRRNKKFFSPINPRCFIVDKEYYSATQLDGIPIRTTEEFFTSHDFTEDTRFMIFMNPANNMARNLLRTFGVHRESIHACSIGLDNGIFR